MRYVITAKRDDAGPINAYYKELATGNGLLFLNGIELLFVEYHGHLNDGSLNTLGIEILPNDPEWHVRLFCKLDIIGGEILEAGIDIMDPGANTTAFNMPVTFNNGPAPAPDYVTVTPVRWYTTAPFPFVP